MDEDELDSIYLGEYTLYDEEDDELLALIDLGYNKDQYDV